MRLGTTPHSVGASPNGAETRHPAPFENANTRSAIVRSDRLARRALGFALDPSVTRSEAAARLLDIAVCNTAVLERARARILLSVPAGVISSDALGAIDTALFNAQMIPGHPDIERRVR
jgi:hypothetical protein